MSTPRTLIGWATLAAMAAIWLVGPAAAPARAGESETSVLVAQLRYARDDDDRERAAKLLGKLGDGQAVTPLIQAAVYDASEDVRDAARKAALKLTFNTRPADPTPVTRDAIGYFIGELACGRTDDDRERAARSLGRLGDARALTALEIAAVFDRDEDVREAAREAAVRIRRLAILAQPPSAGYYSSAEQHVPECPPQTVYVQRSVVVERPVIVERPIYVTPPCPPRPVVVPRPACPPPVVTPPTICPPRRDNDRDRDWGRDRDRDWDRDRDRDRNGDRGRDHDRDRTPTTLLPSLPTPPSLPTLPTPPTPTALTPPPPCPKPTTVIVPSRPTPVVTGDRGRVISPPPAPVISADRREIRDRDGDRDGRRRSERETTVTIERTRGRR